MRMIRLGVDLHRRAAQITQNAAHVSMQFRVQMTRNHLLPVLRRENEVDVDLGEGLRHAGKNERVPALRRSATEMKRQMGLSATQSLFVPRCLGLNPSARWAARFSLGRSQRAKVDLRLLPNARIC